jgi:error-prone DNA polymerase
VFVSKYAELHCHSAFSFLDGASLPEELVIAALELGYDALALTDHNSVSGSMEFAKSAQALGLRAIHGAELDLDDGRHLTLLVQDKAGWSNLCRLITRAHAGTRDGGGVGGSKSTPCISLAEILDHSEGLVCLSGCYSHGIDDEPTLALLRAAFGRQRLCIELQRPYLAGDRARNRRLERLARRLELACVVTGNVHAHTRARAPLQDAFVALRLHSTLDASEPQRRGNFSHVLASPEAMVARFQEYPEAVTETARLSERLQFDLCADLGYRYPGAEDETKRRQLSELCGERLHERYASQGQAAFDTAASRLNQELRIIDKLNLAGFFVLHHELLELAREVAVEVRGRGADGAESPRAVLPPGRGRGSSVSSIVCYLTGLSHVDPVANELHIGRFLSEDLNALPDIDLDFPRDIRAVLIPRVHERFGHDRAALVAAFPTFRARGAIRELGKVLGLPPSEIERVARSSEGWDARGVARDIETVFGAEQSARGGRWTWLARLAAQAHGLPHHLSQHSGGMIVATRPLVDCCPVLPAAMEGRWLAQWDKDSCADAGFLKIDLLGLGMLSAVERCVELIARTRGERVDLSRIPHDDRPTYDAIQKAETIGVFQIESRAQIQSLLRTRPENLKDIAIQVAIVRPGPIQGGAVNPYIQRRQRLRVDPNFQIPYEHPSLEPALRETLGAIIFQDQVLEVAAAFAGFRPGEAEDLRRAMSRKRSEAAIESHHSRFVEGAQRLHGVDEETAERVFAKVKGFSGFGFPKSHAAAFGLLAYQSTWLRVHYGPEFLCALMNEQPMGFYPPDALVHEAQRRGLEVLAPDINASGAECDLDANGNVRIGLGYIRGLRRDWVQALVAERERGGGFTTLSDLSSRAGPAGPALELLAWAGACDSLVDPAAATSPRRLALWRLGMAPAGRNVLGGVQLTLPLDLPSAPALRPLSGWDEVLADYGTTGLTAKAHPMELIRPQLPSGSVDSRALSQTQHGRRVRVGGMVVARQRPGTAGGVVFVLLEDEFGVINLIVPPKVYERHRLVVRSEPLLLAEGKLERYAQGGGAINVLVDKIAEISAPGATFAAIQDFSPRDDEILAENAERSSDPLDAGDFRAVAPPVMSFAAGRRR